MNPAGVSLGLDGSGGQRGLRCDATGRTSTYQDADYLFQEYPEVDPIPAGGAYLTDWIDCGPYPILGFFVCNSGAVNPITNVYIYQSAFAAGTYGVGTAQVCSIPAAQSFLFYPTPGNSSSIMNPTTPARYFRVVALSAAGTKGFAVAVGKR